ncbi:MULTISPECIES: hypothetical protein [unclassified Methylobacterium]|uniref:hypothetical protein n=1 Tax=unclassified Methylobacterium TaxID=2615210 RepID=UPI0003710695|nr:MULTISPECIES: hypothetical protein [unclassified Methylobacterium]KQP48795.1 hypothetical protein ASF34_20875 [Methylobacterium sp. Leaf106]TXN21423.1 hypothetical protein FV220_23045 [Methylobacterium sp. WL19]
MSHEREEGYFIALANMRSHLRRRVNEPDITNDAKLELLDLLSMLDDMLKGGTPPEEHNNDAPEPLSGSF